MSKTNIETNPTTIHPAIDFTAEHAYVGQSIHYRHFRLASNLRIVIDDRSILDFRNVTEEISNISLQYTDFKMEQRWSNEGTKGFINGVEPVEPAKLYARVKAIFKANIELPDERLHDFLTLWSIGTYFHVLFNAYPYVYVGGISGSGKTKLLTLCSHVCFNSVSSGALTPASLFRLIQNTRCAVFLDENEALSNKYSAPDIRNLLLCGYKKGLPVYRTKRTEEGNFEPESFEVYSPKMLVNMEGLETVLGSRCIDIIMQRGSNKNITARDVEFDYPIWQQIRDMIYPFMMKNWKAIKQAYAELQKDTVLQNRDWELWKPILALARFFDSTKLFQSVRALAIEKATENATVDIHQTVLAEVLLSLVDHDDFYRLKDIKQEMAKRLEDGEYIGSRKIGDILRKTFGFTKNRRVGSGYQYFLQVAKVKTLAKSLGISEGSECSEYLGEQGTKITHVRTVTTYSIPKEGSKQEQAPMQDRTEEQTESKEA